jgi:hypothetical protein
MTFTALHPLALVLSILYVQLYGKQQTRGRDENGRVVLRGEDEALHRSNSNGNGNQDAQGRTAREVDVEALWS